MTARFEFKLEDFWIGVFWRHGELNSHVWICLIPCFPLHLEWRRERCPNCGAVVKRLGTASDGRKFCCIHCAFHPGGCLCRIRKFNQPNDSPMVFLPGEDDDDPTEFQT